MTGIDWHLHPMMVHFPIALFISAMIFEAVSLCLRRDILHRTALHIYTLAAILTPLAVQTGLWEAEELNLHHPVLEIHERFALWTMWLALVSLPVLGFTLKKFTKAFRPVFIIFKDVLPLSATLRSSFIFYKFHSSVN